MYVSIWVINSSIVYVYYLFSYSKPIMVVCSLVCVNFKYSNSILVLC